MHDLSSSNGKGSLHGTSAIVFDLDGTLIDSSAGIIASLTAAFEATGRQTPSTNLRNVVGPPIRIIVRNVDPSLSDAEIVAIAGEFRTHYDTIGWRRTVAFEGVVEGLQRLQRAGILLFIVTNKPQKPTVQILELLGLSRVFEGVFSRDNTTPPYASKSAMLADLIAMHGLKATDTAMAGDTAEDEEAAKSNGAHFIHAAYGYGEVTDAEFSIGSFRELEEMLSGVKTQG
jgi:phosphoglycolate phosphatase